MAARAMSKKRISVLVTDDLPGLGSKGEVLSVRPGHARNHLFPKKVREGLNSRLLSLTASLSRWQCTIRQSTASSSRTLPR